MARVVVIGGGFGGLATALRLAKLGHAVTLVEERHARRRARPGDRRRLRLGHRGPHAAARRGARPVPQDRPAAGEGGRAGAARTACASTGSRTAPHSCSRRAAPRSCEAFDGARSRARAAVARPRRARTPTTGRCSAAATWRCPWEPGPPPARGRGEARLTGVAAPAAPALAGATRARGWSRRTPSRSTATTSATCPPGPG